MLFISDPVNGGWSDWSEWTNCDNSEQSRERSCNDPEPLDGGELCEGISSETRLCDTPGETQNSNDVHKILNAQLRSNPIQNSEKLK